MKPVLIMGAGGHAAVLISALSAEGVQILGLLDTDPALQGTSVLGVDVLGGDALITRWSPVDVLLANGIGAAQNMDVRAELFDRLAEQGYRFHTTIHPSATIASGCEIGEGAQVMAGAVIQPRTRIGRNTIVNTRAGVDHDCTIADHVHIAPGATLAGGVKVGNASVIGTGASVIPNIEIGAGAMIAAGATVTANVSASARVAGTPARVMQR